MSAEWLEVRGPPGERRIALDALHVVDIGRGPENAICIDNDQVSRRHALICRAASGHTVLDRGSRNGTQVNGRTIVGEHKLRDGDKIRVGNCEIVFHAGQAGPVESGDTRGSTRLVLDSKPATVLVMDLHDYSGLSHGVEGRVLPALVAELSKRVSGILDARGAAFYKTIGDAVLAVWTHEGAPDIKPALRAVVEIAAEVGRLGSEFRLGDALRVGAGLSTGEVSWGGLGAQRQADVLGDSVNLAFRLEAATRQHAVDLLLCETTWRSLGAVPDALFRCQQTSLKGFRETVTAFGTSYAQLREYALG